MSYITEKMRENVLNLHKKGKGIGAILRHLKKMKMYEYHTTIGIFRFTIKTLQKSNIKFSKKNIRYHFNKFVDKNDYPKELKGEIFKDLYDP